MRGLCKPSTRSVIGEAIAPAWLAASPAGALRGVSLDGHCSGLPSADTQSLPLAGSLVFSSLQEVCGIDAMAACLHEQAPHTHGIPCWKVNGFPIVGLIKGDKKV